MSYWLIFTKVSRDAHSVLSKLSDQGAFHTSQSSEIYHTTLKCLGVCVPSWLFHGVLDTSSSSGGLSGLPFPDTPPSVRFSYYISFMIITIVHNYLTCQSLRLLPLPVEFVSPLTCLKRSKMATWPSKWF